MDLPASATHTEAQQSATGSAIASRGESVIRESRPIQQPGSDANPLKSALESCQQRVANRGSQIRYTAAYVKVYPAARLTAHLKTEIFTHHIRTSTAFFPKRGYGNRVTAHCTADTAGQHWSWWSGETRVVNIDIQPTPLLHTGSPGHAYLGQAVCYSYGGQSVRLVFLELQGGIPSVNFPPPHDVMLTSCPNHAAKPLIHELPSLGNNCQGNPDLTANHLSKLC